MVGFPRFKPFLYQIWGDFVRKRSESPEGEKLAQAALLAISILVDI